MTQKPKVTNNCPYDALLGKQVLVMTSGYFYDGVLKSHTATTITLESPSIVYNVGDWQSKQYQQQQKLHTKQWNISKLHIESFGDAKK